VLRRGVLLAVVFWVCAVGVDSADARSETAHVVPAWLVPNTIAFWDAADGLIGTGFRYCSVGACRGGGAISVTRDGGNASRVVLRTAGPVSWLSVAPGGYAWAVVDRCHATNGCAPSRMLRSRDGGRTWQPLPTAVRNPSFADRDDGVGLRGGACEPAGCVDAGLVSTSDGGRTWHRLASPCRGEEQGLSLVSATHGWLLCASEPGAGNQGKAIYRSDDGFRTWKRLLSLEIGGKPSGGLASYGYALGLAFAPNGAGVLWESRGTLYVTLDSGKEWSPLTEVARPEVDFGSSASVVGGRAFALLSQGDSRYRLVATTRGYGQWRTIRVWSFR